jgi:hypothetical protein
MHPWSRINLGLALLLGALVVVDLWPSPGGGPAPLTQLTPDDISLIRIEQGRRLHLSLQRTDQGWHLTHPDQAAAREERVHQLLAVLGAPRRYSFPGDTDLARFGLVDPAATLRVQGASFDDVDLLFGDREPSQEGRYVLVADAIAVVDDVFFHLLSLPPRHFIED